MQSYLKTLLVILAIIFLFPLLTFFLYIKPPKFNSDTTPEDFNLKYENISFKTRDGLTLRGWFIPSNYSNATIIVGHGFPFDKGNILPATKFLNKHYNLLYYDFRYFGESDGKITTIAYKEQGDLLQAIEHVKKRKKEPIGIMGFSLSAANALLVNSRDVKAIVSDSSFSSSDEMLKRVYWFLPGITRSPFVWLTALYAKIFLNINIYKISPTENVKSLEVPILFIHGKKDSQIPYQHSEKLYNASNKSNSELWLVANADHGMSFSLNQREYQKKVMDFFDKHLLKVVSNNTENRGT